MLSWVALILYLFFAPLDANAQEYSSPSFKVENPQILFGGGFSMSGSFKLNSTIGQEAIGISAGPSFSVKSGFLYFPLPSTPSGQVLPSSSWGGTPFVPAPPKEPEQPKKGNVCDFNGDKSCNIFDLSIFLYWMDKPYERASRYDLNLDGRLDIIDISLIFYYWTT